MGKISRIQLRGISRTPSDRMTEDGGCAESLNVYLDNKEIAPSLVPIDITKNLGFPGTTVAGKVFVHKTPNYENYIAASDGKIIASTSNKVVHIMDLSGGEAVRDFASIGNTVIITTTKSLYYVIYKQGSYKLLGSSVPFPRIDVRTSHEGEHIRNLAISTDVSAGTVSKDEWNDSDINIAEKERVIAAVWKGIEKIIGDNLIKKRFTFPRVMQYAVELYDGNKYSSMPFFVGFSKDIPVVELQETSTDIGGSNVGMLNYPGEYSMYLQLQNADVFLDWLDVVKSIKIYLSPDILSLADKTKILESTSFFIEGGIGNTPDGEEYNITVIRNILSLISSVGNIPELLTAASPLFLIQEYKIESDRLCGVLSDDIQSLSDGIAIGAEGEAFPTATLESGTVIREDKLVLQERLAGDMMYRAILSADSLSVYNNRLALIGAAQDLVYDYPSLNSIYESQSMADQEYQIIFVVNGNGKDVFVNGGRFLIPQGLTVLPLQTFPDSRCYKMLVRARINGQQKWGELHMRPHPSLDCAYYAQPISYRNKWTEFHEALTGQVPDFAKQDARESIGNQLYLSETNNPFFFSSKSIYTFSGKTLGVAAATKALSQGQFGQFPLYVFTEDGIWAMEVHDDGSLYAGKPLSREVCVNPRAIVPLDNSIVFVTSQGVKMLQGADVADLSAYMNGRHYVLEPTPRMMIENTPFADLANLLQSSYSKTFLEFIKKAVAVYDYVGKKVIFFSDEDRYHYLYKLDTQTWHKASYDMMTLAYPINAYPKSLVQGSIVKDLKTIKIKEYVDESAIDRVPNIIKRYLPWSTEKEIQAFIDMIGELDITGLNAEEEENLNRALDDERIKTEILEGRRQVLTVYDMTSVLDANAIQPVAKGCVVTRPLDFGEPDVLKSITDIRIRGQYAKGSVGFILMGSMDGIHFHTINTLRGKAWKLFKLIILSKMDATERISWIDVQYETKFTNKLR